MIQSLEKLDQLGDDWDGCGSPAPLAGVVSMAILIARRLGDEAAPLPDAAVPTPAGTVLFSWEDGKSYLEIEATGSNTAEWMRLDSEGNESHGEFRSHS